MFDIAYIVEATIAAAEIELEKTWHKMLRLDLAASWWIVEIFYINHLREIKKYSSIMYGTHGG